MYCTVIKFFILFAAAGFHFYMLTGGGGVGVIKRPYTTVDLEIVEIGTLIGYRQALK
jgi:hypothetical protein